MSDEKEKPVLFDPSWNLKGARTGEVESIASKLKKEDEKKVDTKVVSKEKKTADVEKS